MIDQLDDIKDNNKTIKQNRLIEKADDFLSKEKRLVYIDREEIGNESMDYDKPRKTSSRRVVGQENKFMVYGVIVLVLVIAIIINMYALW